uniref:Uncharacterized protein n=1 Tax=Mesocestoides corti TaxID=53468 RepID=A0A5K3FBX3_MESCO
MEPPATSDSCQKFPDKTTEMTHEHRPGNEDPVSNVSISCFMLCLFIREVQPKIPDDANTKSR